MGLRGGPTEENAASPRAAGNKLVAEELLGIAPSRLYRKMRALGLDPKRRA